MNEVIGRLAVGYPPVKPRRNRTETETNIDAGEKISRCRM
jgi:hypothetical protein